MPVTSNIRRPHAAAAPLSAVQVAAAYHFPTGRYTGKGYTCGIVELGGGFGHADLETYFARIGLPVPSVVAVPVDGGSNTSDGPNGADGEVLLDIEVAGTVAPGAAFRVYFAPNTDAGFAAAIKQAAAECDVISISWGGPENQWAPASIKAMEQAISAARAAGVTVFVASGDSGADDGTRAPVTDYPASSPHVIACGGTRLTVDTSGQRVAEVAWDDNPTSSASGGGVSKVFPGRQVPDIAGNADPNSGYHVVVDGNDYVIGGTSAVAPLYAGLALLLCEALGERVGKRADVLATLAANPSACFDVTSGSNGAYRAGPGRDEVTGIGVVDGARLLGVYTGGGSTPTPTPTPGPTPTPPAAALTLTLADQAAVDAVTTFAASPHKYHIATVAADAVKAGTWA